MMIGDGIGPLQVGLLESYGQESVYRGQSSAMKRLVDDGVLGMSLHSPKDVILADSAYSATPLAAGVYAGSEMIGLDDQGNQGETILEKANGWAMPPVWSPIPA